MDDLSNDSSIFDTLIKTAGQVISTDNAAKRAADAQNNATAANAVATAQAAKTQDSRLLIYGGLAVVALIAVVLYMRR